MDTDVEVVALDAVANSQVFANKVWPSGNNGSGVRLAILDTGINTKHAEFKGRIIACATEVKGTTDCEDDNGHGTLVAGIAGAKGKDTDAKGVAPSVLLMSDKILDSKGTGNMSDIIAGIDWAVSNNAHIISMSLGTQPVDGGGKKTECNAAYPSLTTAINNVVAAGITVVAAAGNSGKSGLGAPACIENVIAVGAVDSYDKSAYFSSKGLAMKDHGIAAPGVELYSPYVGDIGYWSESGTSMATPVVSGTIALMLSKNPNLSPAYIKNILFSTADCVTITCPNIDIGYGRINALKAVKNVDITAPSIIGVFPLGNNVPLNTQITITFNVSMNTSSAESAFSTVPATSGTFSWSGNTMTYTPGSNLNYNTIYNVSVGTGAKDSAGNKMLSSFNWEFTTVATSSSITVTSPNGGESWSRRKTYTIDWNYSGDPGNAVKIELLSSGKVVGVINSSTPMGSGGSGSYQWTITQRIGTAYTVRVTSVTTPACTDVSDNYFSILRI